MSKVINGILITDESIEELRKVDSEIMNDQTAKKDAGKPRLSLVPTQILYDICKVREFAVDNKYKNPDNWKNVEIQRYRDAAFRHFLLYLNDPKGVDEESGLPHLSHLATNIAFLCELEKEDKEIKKNEGLIHHALTICPKCGKTKLFCPTCGYTENV